MAVELARRRAHGTRKSMLLVADRKMVRST